MYIVAFFNCLSQLDIGTSGCVFGAKYPQCNAPNSHEIVRAGESIQFMLRHSLCEAFFFFKLFIFSIFIRIRFNSALFPLLNCKMFQISFILELKAYFIWRCFFLHWWLLLFQKLNQFVWNYQIAFDLGPHFSFK